MANSVFEIAERPAPRPIHQPLPSPLHLRDLSAAKARAEAICQAAIATMPGGAEGREAGEWQLQDLERAIQDAYKLVDAVRYQERMAELQAAAIAQQAAEEAKRNRLTAADPAVIEARETLRRLNSAGLQLLLQAENITPAQSVAAKALLQERANEALVKATSGAASSSATGSSSAE